VRKPLTRMSRNVTPTELDFEGTFGNFGIEQNKKGGQSQMIIIVTLPNDFNRST
jgi:hypothetical protein